MIINEIFFSNLLIYLREISKVNILPNLGKVKEVDINIKKDKSKATKFDILLEGLLINYFKNLGIVSFIAEESYPNFFTNKNCYITLDPIDGTNNFINGSENVAIMISYIENEKNIFSVIYDPIKNNMYHMFQNKVFKNLKQHETKLLKNHVGFLNNNVIDTYNKLLTNYINKNKTNSIGYDLIQIIEGERNLISMFKGNVWDIFPVIGFLEALKFKSTNIDKLNYNFSISELKLFYYAEI